MRLTSLSAEREGSANVLPDSAIERSRVDKVAVVEESEKLNTVESCHKSSALPARKMERRKTNGTVRANSKDGERKQKQNEQSRHETLKHLNEFVKAMSEKYSLEMKKVKRRKERR